MFRAVSLGLPYSKADVIFRVLQREKVYILRGSGTGTFKRSSIIIAI